MATSKVKVGMKTFQLTYHLDADIGISVPAESLEDAIAKGREMRMDKVLEHDWEWQDGDSELRGAWTID